MTRSRSLLAAAVLIGVSVSNSPARAALAHAGAAARPVLNVRTIAAVGDTVHAWLDTAALRKHLHYPKSSLASGTGGIATIRYGIGALGTTRVLSMHCGAANGDSAQFCDIVSAAMKGVRITPARINGNEVEESLILSVLFSVDRAAKVPRPVFDIVLVRVLGPVPHIIKPGGPPPPYSGSPSAPQNSRATSRVDNRLEPQVEHDDSATVERPPAYDENELSRNFQYPEIARRNGIEGYVVVSALIGKDGRVERTVIAKAADPILNDAAVAAVRGTKFTPAIDTDGNKVKLWIQIPFTFSLSSK